MKQKIILSICFLMIISLCFSVSAYEEEYNGADGFGLKLIDHSGGEDSTLTLLALTYEVQGEILTGKRFGVIMEDYVSLEEAKNTFNNYKGTITRHQQQDFKEVSNKNTGEIDNVWLSNNKVIRVFGYDKKDDLERNAFYFLFEQIIKEYPSTISTSDYCGSIGEIHAEQYCSSELLWANQKGKEDYCENNYECQSNICVDNMCVEKGLFTKFLNWFRNIFK